MKISAEFCFTIEKVPQEIDALVSAYKIFLSKKQKTSISILDTNVLLNFYQLPYPIKITFQHRLKNSQSDIYLTEQIKEEFYRHQKSLHQKFKTRIKEAIGRAEFQSGIEILNFYLKEHEDLLEYYPNFENELFQLKDYLSLLEKEFEDFKKSLTIWLQQKADSFQLDKDIEMLKLLPSLSKEEKAFLEIHYQQLCNDAQLEKYESLNQLLNHAPFRIFPGAADFIKRNNRKSGDFIIFHELLSSLYQNKERLSFYTFDLAKGDWLNEKHQTHLHYLSLMYRLCNSFFEIKKGDDFFHAFTDSFFLLNTESDYLNECLEMINHDDILQKKFTLERFINVINKILYPRKKPEDPTLLNTSFQQLKKEYQILSLESLQINMYLKYTSLLKYELEMNYLTTQEEAIAFMFKK